MSFIKFQSILANDNTFFLQQKTLYFIRISPAVDEEVHAGADSKKEVVKAYLECKKILVDFPKCTVSQSLNVFVPILKCFCPNRKMYLQNNPNIVAQFRFEFCLYLSSF